MYQGSIEMMTNTGIMLATVEAGASAHHLNFLLLLGIAVVGGTIGAKIFQKMHIPQVVGYIIIGLLLGESGFKIVNSEVIDAFEPLTYFALGIIGFMIGGELQYGIFKKFGKQFMTIMVAEGMSAFFLVGVGSTVIAYMVTGDIKLSIAVGVILGAISSATDPSSTMQVLWEYKTRGPLTTAATAVVALDDVLALTLYAIGSAIAGALTNQGQVSIATAFGEAFYVIAVSLFVGFVAGVILDKIFLKIEQKETALTFVIGAVLVVLGLSVALKLDIILASMALGVTLINCSPRRSKKAFELIKVFAPPIYVLFFVLVGARLNIGGLNKLAWMLAGVYIVGRSAGKIGGVYLGAVLSGGERVVKKYLGLCLFAQGGVAIGLSIMASHKFEPEIASIVVIVVAATTLFVQIAGPLCVKYGVKKAGEVGLNITEDDLIETYTVKDVVETDIPLIDAGERLGKIIEIVSDTENLYYPVVDSDKNVVASITLESIRKTFAMKEAGDWLVALDIADPVVAFAELGEPLKNALHIAKKLDIEFLPVTDNQETNHFAGLLIFRHIRRSLTAEVLSRQQKADTIHKD